ncbi:uncharacterized protein N7503_006580 [Penicillium pulvis]|uniref:uncharacterized protein n=1 Tax=Penicillium pulvis TaxID=1562058 RepID=UPI002547ADF9|nr:uncharacterized protein N7503_006580 [Penicillium pulvis]KAJ5797284.1 hypothetical protein N7503_006580 [Penicillium pulvis]
MASLPMPLHLLFLAFLPTPVFARAQFQDWFAEYGFIFNRIISENCPSEYEFYKTGHTNNTLWMEHIRWLGSEREVLEQLTVPLINCMLGACPEFIKSDMAGANVLLGLAPSILAVLGSDIDETSLLAVVGNRPFLALILAAGSPAVVPMRPLEYRDPLEALKARTDELPLKFYSYPVEVVISIVEYGLRFAAIANTIEMTLSLGFQTILSFAPGYPYFVITWALLGLFAHSCAALGLRLRTRRADPIPNGKHWWSFITHIGEVVGFPSHTTAAGGDDLYNKLKRLFTGYSKEDPPPKFVVKRLTICTWTVNLILAVMTSCHVILGTLIFSSMLFISTRDAVYVLGRFMCSVLVCRALLMYELAKLRVLYNQPLAVASEMGSYHHLITIH